MGQDPDKTQISHPSDKARQHAQAAAASPSGVAWQDLSAERLLRDAPKMLFGGRACPSLSGIPLVAKLGQGGMGAVYYGVHPRLNNEVAIKVLPFHLADKDPDMIKRFVREAQMAAMVRSPHLVNVMDVNEEAGLHYLVMEYVHGATAGHFVKGDRLTEHQMLDVCIAATQGLCAAHDCGIIHRDVKPDNIMIPFKAGTSDPNYPASKLMDLGLARSETAEQSLTCSQAAMGTPGYMAPEQALDAKTADKRSDVFGMGCVLYALVTGRAPFRGSAIMNAIMATMNDPHEPIRKVNPGASKEICRIVDKCLEKKQSRRYSDGHELLEALSACRASLLKPKKKIKWPGLPKVPSLPWARMLYVVAIGVLGILTVRHVASLRQRREDALVAPDRPGRAEPPRQPHPDAGKAAPEQGLPEIRLPDVRPPVKPPEARPPDVQQKPPADPGPPPAVPEKKAPPQRKTDPEPPQKKADPPKNHGSIGEGNIDDN